jgi:hypothetical protein
VVENAKQNKEANLMRRLTVLGLSLQLVFPGLSIALLHERDRKIL